MDRLTETEQVVIDAMQRRKERIKQWTTTRGLMIDSQRVDTLFLLDQGRLPKTEIALYAGVSRPTLDAWIADRLKYQGRQDV